MEAEKVQFTSVGDFLSELKRVFREENNESTKMAEFKRVEQKGKTMKEFVQKFRRAVRRNGYEAKTLVKIFKRRMSGVVRRKLIEAKRSLRSIGQSHERVVNLNYHWKESKKEEERLKRKKKGEGNVQEQR